MTELYGHRWTASFGVIADQNHAWARALAGLTGEQIAAGLCGVIAAAMKWPPTAPEFRALCEARPTAESLGLPSEDRAYAEAIRNAHPATAASAQWSHPVVSHAARECGLFNLGSMPAEASRKLFSRCYSIACRMVIDGEPLRPIVLALPEKAEPRITPEVGRAALDELRRATRKLPKDEGESCEG
jgi:hypothetical protein